MNSKQDIIELIRKYIRKDSGLRSVPRFFYKYIIRNKDNIIKTENVLFSIFEIEKEKNQFKKFNGIRIEYSNDDKSEGVIWLLDKQILINLLIEYKKLEKMLILPTPSSTNEYVSAKESINILIDEEDGEEYEIDSEDGKDYITPDPSTTYDDILQNLFVKSNIKFKFNSKININNNVNSNTTIKTTTLKITGKMENIIMPTSYRVVCRAHTEHGECLNTVRFYKGHKATAIKCTLNNSDKKGHTIKTTEVEQPSEVRQLYGYTAQLHENDNEEEEQILILSFEKLEKDLFKCNYVHVHDKVPHLLILGVEYIDDTTNPLTGKILEQNPERKFFIDDIYESIKTYYKKYHDYEITNQNKVVAWFIIMQMMTNLFLGHRYHGMYIGKSGSGKTFFGTVLVPLFTFNHKTVLGTTVTRNRFLGGKSNVVSEVYNTYYQAGFVHTRDILVIDEATEKLDQYFSDKTRTTDNIFTMMKAVNQNIDIGIQGSFEGIPKASIVLFGNLEQLKTIRDEYTKSVRRKYKNLSKGKAFPQWMPLYRAPEWYKEAGNEDLGMAHAIIRGKEFNHSHYITGLPEAEMSRFTFFIALEDINRGFKEQKFIGAFEAKRSLHRTEFVNELKQVFGNMRKKEYPLHLMREVNKWLNEFFGHQRNNIRFSSIAGVNTHTFKNLEEMFTDIIWMNKIYYNQEEKLTDKDKELMEYLLLHNNNSLDMEEANLSKIPKVNDIHFGEAEIELYENQRQEEYKSKLMQQEHELDEEFDDGKKPDNKFGGLPDDEFD